jgi:hypothetical protein
MMTCGGDGFLDRVGGTAAVQQPHDTPGFTRFEPIEAMAGRHAGFTARTAVQIYFKAVLLPGSGLRQGNQAPVVLCLVGQFVLVMQLREALHRCQFLLLCEALMQHRKKPLRRRHGWQGVSPVEAREIH